MSNQVKIKIYVEGGGTAQALKSEMRQAFQSFFIGWGLEGCLPSVIACGSRNEAFDDFQTAFKKAKPQEIILLLVDSEEYPAQSVNKWQHVNTRDNWDKPAQATEENLFFMTVCMESWLMADKPALATFFGKNFQEKLLPSESITEPLEKLSKETIYSSLKNATRQTQKGEYGKGNHSFKILAKIDSMKVVSHGQYAKEFYGFLQDKLK